MRKKRFLVKAVKVFNEHYFDGVIDTLRMSPEQQLKTKEIFDSIYGPEKPSGGVGE